MVVYGIVMYDIKVCCIIVYSMIVYGIRVYLL